MAESQQLINQAKSGNLFMQGLREFAGKGTPNITQPAPSPDIEPTNIRPDVPEESASQGNFLQGLQAFAQQQAPQQGLPVAETVPARPEQLEHPSFFRDVIGKTAYDAGKAMVVAGKTAKDIAEEATIPAVTGAAGGALGTMASPGLGTVAGAAAGSALGTYINDLMNIQDAQIQDYVLAAGLPVAGGAVSKVGKAALRRMPSVAKAMNRQALKMKDLLARMSVKEPGKEAVRGAFNTLDEMGAAMPTAGFKDDIAKLSPYTNKKLTREIKTVDPEIVEALTDDAVVLMRPTKLRDYRSHLQTLRKSLGKSDKLADKKAAREIGDVLDNMDNHINEFAASGDEAAKAIQTANKLTKQQKTYEDIDLLLKNAVKSKVEGGEITSTINVAKIWDRVNKIENVLDKGRHSTDKLTQAVIELRKQPEAMQTFKEGLQNIAKMTPKGEIQISGLLEKGARAVGEELNTGTLTAFLGTKPGQILLRKVIGETGGKLNVPIMATMMAAIRPSITGVMPQDDPEIQAVNKTVGDLQQVMQSIPTKQASKKNQ